MVGYSSVGPTDPGSAFIYDGTSFVTLNGPAGAIGSYALGISDSGRVVGSYTTAALGPSHGFIYAGGSYTTFDVAGATETFLRGISPDGRYISGYYSTTTQAGVGFVYDTRLGTIAIVSVPTSAFTIAQGINSSGIVAGGDIVAGPPTTRPGFLYDIATGTRTEQSIAGATRTALRTIDDAGLVAGRFLDAFNVIGNLWPNGDRGCGKTHLLHVVCELAYLGQVILAGYILCKPARHGRLRRDAGLR